MKYVIFQDKHGFLQPVTFPDYITHSRVAVENMKPVSAGFVDPRTGECHGHSDSLNLKPHPDDQHLLMAALTNNTAMLALLMFETREESKV